MCSLFLNVLLISHGEVKYINVSFIFTKLYVLQQIKIVVFIALWVSDKDDKKGFKCARRFSK